MIEEERKKREEILAKVEKESQGKYAPTYITVIKNGNVANESQQILAQLPNQPQQLQQIQEIKKPKRKIKIRKPVVAQSDDESNKNATPSGVIPVINEDIPTNGKTPVLNTVTLPKITNETPTLKPHKEKDHNDNPSLRKLKRQISNVKYIHERYEMLKTLGDGNFAVVKQARLRSTENEYAIKVIDKSKMKVNKLTPIHQFIINYSNNF